MKPRRMAGHFLFMENFEMDEIRTCALCGCTLGDDETAEVNGDLICDSCTEEHTVECDHCEETNWMNDAIADGRRTANASSKLGCVYAISKENRCVIHIDRQHPEKQSAD